jgi:hypothetical protein
MAAPNKDMPATAATTANRCVARFTRTSTENAFRSLQHEAIDKHLANPIPPMELPISPAEPRSPNSKTPTGPMEARKMPHDQPSDRIEPM